MNCTTEKFQEHRIEMRGSNNHEKHGRTRKRVDTTDLRRMNEITTEGTEETEWRQDTEARITTKSTKAERTSYETKTKHLCARYYYFNHEIHERTRKQVSPNEGFKFSQKFGGWTRSKNNHEIHERTRNRHH